jgi:hypothetical protein
MLTAIPRQNCSKTGNERVTLTLRRVHEITAAMEVQQVLHILSVRACVRVRDHMGLCIARLALLILHANFLRRLSSSVVSLTPPHISTLSQKRHVFRKKKLLNII